MTSRARGGANNDGVHAHCSHVLLLLVGTLSCRATASSKQAGIRDEIVWRQRWSSSRFNAQSDYRASYLICGASGRVSEPPASAAAPVASLSRLPETSRSNFPSSLYRTTYLHVPHTIPLSLSSGQLPMCLPGRIATAQADQ